MEQWREKVAELKIPSGENPNMVHTLGDPMLLREWMMKGLPSDQIS
jgi:dynein heavy chain, axonemal